MQAASTRRILRVVFTAIIAAVLFFVSALPAWAAESMTLTFVRHGQSQANADDRIDTSVPGPGLTTLGQQQAADIAIALADRDFDGIYASNMVRTQQTAAPLAAMLGQPVVVLPGLREINAGIFEGSPESGGLGRLGYAVSPALWTLGARFVPVLGAPDGNAFDARVDNAIRTIYDSGDRNAVAFAHGATIMFWVMMNVDNPDLGLMLRRPLGNTGVVVVTGNPDDGWVLTEWDGVAVSANPPLLTKLFVDVRDLVTAPQTALYNIGQAFASGDIAALANAVRDGVIDVVKAVVEFVPNVVRDVVDEFSRSSARTVDEPVNINATDDSSPTELVDGTGEPDPAPTAETAETADEPETASLLTKVKKRAGATDLTSGNKVNPGDTIETTGTDADADADADAVAAPGDLKGVVTSLTDRLRATLAPDKPEAADTDTGAEQQPAA
ncbi:histidine phosphatase family protein [Mycolicibacterium holsaticum]|uniref:histidine phosphatase family protein n=1 Tax=Mycolicibacterium holsaticum TaxID=152142 RepID=UPI001C7E0D66|nr:histidine phosphatase family protein [Mycolicibacterium holsaticum]QZA13211.1 histidine phosphatase family protein [Mycolicibacterium holsaticum DSM 44478 = JCM 12374]UNC09319.1 histidine phosphatase family protein [Mycolicibacterium holsaticum DSM 44478 = JCM 12374]